MQSGILDYAQNLKQGFLPHDGQICFIKYADFWPVTLADFLHK
jgi:hypothetical protein